MQMDLTMIGNEEEKKDSSVIGKVYGDTGTDSFKFILSGGAERSDYVVAEHPDCGPVLCQIDSIIRKSNYTLDRIQDSRFEEKVIATAFVVGYRDSNGLLTSPRTPFEVGIDVKIADAQFIAKMLGLKEDGRACAYVGLLRNHDLRVMLDINGLIQRNTAVIGRTGGGKSYVTGVLVEELTKRGLTCMVVDTHGEYGAMRDPAEGKGDMRFGVTPRPYSDSISEFARNEGPGIRPLRFTLRSLDARDIMEICASSDSKVSILALSKAIENVKARKDFYDISDLIEELRTIDQVKHFALIRDLQSLDGINLFAERGNSLSELVQEGKATVINLKGYSPDIQQIIVRRLGNMLYEMRRNERIPPMMMILEDAHLFCPPTDSSFSRKAIMTIASEGRKYGLGLTIVSQRPAKIDSDVLSQCGTHIILKITNPNDLKAISESIEGLTPGMEQDIASLPTGTALIVGAGIQSPLLTEIRPRESAHGEIDPQYLEDDYDE